MKYKMKMNKNKKGTEKPIEIFLALFIILAVSMVMLKLFQGQIQDKTKEMKDVARETELEQAIEDSKLLCQRRCTDAIQEGCTAKAITAYCIEQLGMIRGTEKALDLNKDGIIGFQRISGLGVCEDAVYCPHLSSCRCGQELSFSYCVQKACEYWDNMGLNATEVLDTSYPPDSLGCNSSVDYNAAVMWNRQLDDLKAQFCN